MQWLEMPEGWKVLDINWDTESCYVYVSDRDSNYGALLRKHNGEWYFSIFDRCIWYRIPKEVD